jgi:hypothetical protein
MPQLQHPVRLENETKRKHYFQLRQLYESIVI